MQRFSLLQDEPRNHPSCGDVVRTFSAFASSKSCFRLSNVRESGYCVELGEPSAPKECSLSAVIKSRVYIRLIGFMVLLWLPPVVQELFALIGA